MLHYKSKPNDILNYIEQLKLLLLSEEEKNQINQILSLDKLIKNSAIKELIQEDLKDEKWLLDTQILINTCCKKIEKSNVVQKHIDECLNFIVYRFLEDKASYTDIEIYKHIGIWHFNLVDKKGNSTKWVNQKFMNSFKVSTVDILFNNLLQENNQDSYLLTLSWLHSNRALFYSENIFKDLKSLQKEGKELIFD